MSNFRKMLIVGIMFFVVNALLYYNINSVKAATCTSGCTNTINKGPGADTCIKGSSLNDCIYAGLGNDTLAGNDGEDCLYGQGGNDILYGGCDGDNFYGGLGDDTYHYKAGEGDSLFTNLGTDTTIADDTTCGAIMCKSDFRIKYNMLPVNTDSGTTSIFGESDPSSLDMVIFPDSSLEIQGIENIKPEESAKLFFAKKGFEVTIDRRELPSNDELIRVYGSYSIKNDPETEGQLIVNVPAYSKDQSLVLASELFVPDNGTYTMYDYANYETTILKDVNYVRFSNTAMIPVQ